MGETEREILEVCQRIRDMGGHNHMFAFFPERGSLMEDWPAVDRAQWRRVQLGRFIIDYAGGRIDRMHFDDAGRVTDFGLPDSELGSLIESGKPFRTSGCPGEHNDISACNRPYGDSSPSDILSYPFAPETPDVAEIRQQMARSTFDTGT
jgi:biotin synthase